MYVYIYIHIYIYIHAYTHVYVYMNATLESMHACVPSKIKIQHESKMYIT